MNSSSDLMLILDRDTESLGILRTVADRLGCDRIEVESAEGLREILAVRRPTIAVLAVDCIDADGLAILQSLAQNGARPATLLVGSVGARVLVSAKRAVQSHGLPVVGVAARPLDAAAAEQLLTPYLSAAPPIPLDELERAFDDNELILQYQPKIEIASHELKVQGVEALIRWVHPRRGLLDARSFIAAVDEHELMMRLTDFVMTEALRQVGQWRARDLHLDMVVNLNPRLVRDRAFPDRLEVLLHEYEVPAQQLILDVTESPSEADRDLMLDVFTRLRILGIGLSLDNFGSGMSSLTELYRMPFSEVKVDHSLIADVSREPDAMLIVQAIAQLAHTLQLSVCAEGVETRQVLEFVRKVGFDTAQGRFFSGPVSAGEIERLVRTWPGAGPAATSSWRALKPLGVDLTTSTNRMRLKRNEVSQ